MRLCLERKRVEKNSNVNATKLIESWTSNEKGAGGGSRREAADLRQPDSGCAHRTTKEAP